MKKFLKDTRGVVMLEYIILGLFAVAVTIAAVHVLGQAYSNGLITIAKATVGNTDTVVASIDYSANQIMDGVTQADEYGADVTTAGQDATPVGFSWAIYPTTTP